MAYIFHIIDKKNWHTMEHENNQYCPDTLKSEGFIHCAKPDQILEILEAMFKTQKNHQLILLKINMQLVNAQIKIEPPFEFPMSEVFYPHIYGPLNLNAIEEEIDILLDDYGHFILPKIL